MRSLTRLAGALLRIAAGTAFLGIAPGTGAAADPGGPETDSGSPLAPASIPAVDVRVAVQDFGEFLIRLDREGSPNAVAAFLALAASGAYDSLAFHRVIPGYLVQTGNPATRGEGSPVADGPPWRLPPESSPRSHRRGTVSFAWRDDDPGSAGMEWFITLADIPRLDGHATPIGEVVEGLDVVDRLSQVSTFRDRRPIRIVRITDARLEASAVTDTAAGPPTDADPSPPADSPRGEAPLEPDSTVTPTDDPGAVPASP